MKILIDEPKIIEFGENVLTLIPFPGHSPCTIVTKINDTYINVADELMFSDEGKPLLPTTDPGCIERHIESLNRMKEFNSYILLPSHGPAIQGEQAIKKDIDNRIAYFKEVLYSKKRITYKEATRNCDYDFVHSEWHEFIYD